jgi:hypothetical protein
MVEPFRRQRRADDASWSRGKEETVSEERFHATAYTHPSVTENILEEPAKCSNCRRDILEKSLVEPA